MVKFLSVTAGNFTTYPKDVFGLHPDDMKTSQESQSTPEIKPTIQVSRESESGHQNNRTDALVGDSGSISTSSNDNKKVSRQDIELVQNLIERCLQLYMNKDEVVKTLLSRAKIDPGFTALVWQKLEEENADFFRAYYIRLKLKKQILLFNQLLEHQYHLMKYPPQKVPLPPIQNGVHPMHVNHLPMGYPVHPPPPMHAAGQHHMDTMGMVNGVPAPGNYHPMRMNSGMDMAIDNSGADVAPILPPGSAMSSMPDMPMSPLSATSSGHFPFSTSGVDTSALDAAFGSEVADTVGLQLAPDDGSENCRDSYRSLDQMTWNFSLSDLTADLSNLGDLGALGNYPGSPFLPSDSDLLLDSPEHDDMVEEFFVDSVPDQGSPSDKDKL